MSRLFLWMGMALIATAVTWFLFAATLQVTASAKRDTDTAYGLPVTLEFAPPEQKSIQSDDGEMVEKSASPAFPVMTAPDIPGEMPVPVMPKEAPPMPDMAPPDSYNLPDTTVSMPDLPAQVSPPDGIWDSADVDKAALLVRKIAPVYPFAARRKNITGRVVLRLVVNTSGQVSEVTVISSTPPKVFDQAAVRAVWQWQFSPAILGDQAVPTRFEQTITFRLDNGNG